MSCYKALPLLFINLGGEMLYILDQRLTAQKIAHEKSVQVMHDIINTMFNTHFMEELFKSQPLYSKASVRMLFDKLAHASIMKLNAASMDKLYDLMTMAVKYQIVACQRPFDVFLITLNHLDSIAQFIPSSSAAGELVTNVSRLLWNNFSNVSLGQWQIIRSTLLNFFQGIHIRVSIFLKDKVQNANGKFFRPVGGDLPYGFLMPGTIKCYDENGTCHNTKFNVGASYSVTTKEGCIASKGDRVIRLGLNMYKEYRPIETQAVVSKRSTVNTIPSSDLDSQCPNPNATAQLNLLAQLISKDSGSKSKPNFKLSLFQSDEDENSASQQKPYVIVQEQGSQVITIDGSKKSTKSELTKIMGEMNIEKFSDSKFDGDDLLDLMDS